MLEKIKGLGTHVANTTGDAVNGAVKGITTSVKGGVESLASAATAVSDAVNEKAVRASTAQMCTILEIAIQEMRSRPLSERPVSLTTSVNFGIATLEMQVHLQPGEAGAGGTEVVTAASPVQSGD